MDGNQWLCSKRRREIRALLLEKKTNKQRPTSLGSCGFWFLKISIMILSAMTTFSSLSVWQREKKNIRKWATSCKSHQHFSPHKMAEKLTDYRDTATLKFQRKPIDKSVVQLNFGVRGCWHAGMHHQCACPWTYFDSLHTKENAQKFQILLRTSRRCRNFKFFVEDHGNPGWNMKTFKDCLLVVTENPKQKPRKKQKKSSVCWLAIIFQKKKIVYTGFSAGIFASRRKSRRSLPMSGGSGALPRKILDFYLLKRVF